MNSVSGLLRLGSGASRVCRWRESKLAPDVQEWDVGLGITGHDFNLYCFFKFPQGRDSVTL